MAFWCTHRIHNDVWIETQVSQFAWIYQTDAITASNDVVSIWFCRYFFKKMWWCSSALLTSFSRRFMNAESSIFSYSFINFWYAIEFFPYLWLLLLLLWLGSVSVKNLYFSKKLIIFMTAFFRCCSLFYDFHFIAGWNVNVTE